MTQAADAYRALAANPAAAPTARITAHRAAYLLDLPNGATVRFSSPTAPGRGDDAFVFLGGYTPAAQIPYTDHYPEAHGAAFMLKVEGDNLDPAFAEEDVKPDIHLVVDERTARSVAEVLAYWAAGIGRIDVRFVHDPTMEPVASHSARIRAAYPSSCVDLT